MNGNTKRSTDTWIKRYSKWATERGHPIDITCIPPERLDSILQQFYAELRKKNGDEYEPESLKVMQTALDRYLRDQGYTSSILRDKEFVKCLMAKLSNCMRWGRGKDP